MKLRIKYCGGCNPSIKRSQILNEIITNIMNVAKVEIVNDKADVGIIIAGCSVCCINLKEIEDQARYWVIIGGDLVDYRQVPPGQISKITTDKILKLLKKIKQ